MMQAYMLGLSFKTADVEVRERVAFNRTSLPTSLKALCEKPAIRGAVILSTCNRMEIYVDSDDALGAREDICAFIAETKGIERSLFEGHLYERVGFEAVHHLFSVVSSLDSMVLGEQQISGQVRTAYKVAAQAGSCTMVLAHLFRQALGCGKRVRNQTSISESHVSVSTVAIDLAREAFASFEDKTVLVVGAGEMSELAARYLREQGVSSFIVSSRTHAHACALAEELGGEARRYEELEALVGMADIIISSTAAPHYVLVPSMMRDIKDALFILDIALPRDVDPAVKGIPGVTLYDLDDISERINRNQEARRAATEQAVRIVEEETQLFVRWVGEHAVVPTIKQVRFDAEAIRAHEVEHLLRTLDADLSEADREALTKATQAIVKKLLHMPTIRMKQAVDTNTTFQAVEAVRWLAGYADGMVEHAHAMDSGMPAAGATMPSHASSHHEMVAQTAQGEHPPFSFHMPCPHATGKERVR